MDNKLHHKYISELLDDYDIFLFDLWGVIIEGDKTYPGVVDAINKIIEQKKVYFVSNAPRPNYLVKETLERFGLKNLNKDMIVTSGDVARDYIEDYKSKNAYNSDRKISIYHLGSDRNDDLLDNLDYTPSKGLEGSDLMILSLYRDENENIHEFDELLKSVPSENIPVICANPDTTIPKQGILRYCAGYFAEIMEDAGGRVIYTGKPRIEIYQKIFSLEPNTPKNRILMIGDTFDTDILGGQNSGIHSALVLTGNSVPHHKDAIDTQDKLNMLDKKSKELGIIPTVVVTIQ